MKKITWKKLIKETKNKVKLIWYWSLLNSNTHHTCHIYKPVIFYWFKRVYNLKILTNESEKEFLEFFKQYLEKYNITTEKEIKELIKSNICALNCIPTWNKLDKVNWLCMEIKKEDLYDYSVREKQYDLIETQLDYICTKTWKITKSKEIWYVLTAKNEETIKKWIPFKQYHINTRNWAYNFWEHFWKMFDNSTYTIDWELVNIQ